MLSLLAPDLAEALASEPDCSGRASALTSRSSPAKPRGCWGEARSRFIVNRYYDPALGRFISRDPLGVWGDPSQMGNGQSAFSNNPINVTDPFGLDVIFYRRKPLAGHAWVKIGGKELNPSDDPEGKRGRTYGGYPGLRGGIWGWPRFPWTAPGKECAAPMRVLTPDTAHEEDTKDFTYTRYETTEEEEKELEDWIRETYVVGHNGKDPVTGKTNRNYDLLFENCRDFAKAVREHLVEILERHKKPTAPKEEDVDVDDPNAKKRAAENKKKTQELVNRGGNATSDKRD